MTTRLGLLAALFLGVACAASPPPTSSPETDSPTVADPTPAGPTRLRAGEAMRGAFRMNKPDAELYLIDLQQDQRVSLKARVRKLSSDHCWLYLTLLDEAGEQLFTKDFNTGDLSEANTNVWHEHDHVFVAPATGSYQFKLHAKSCQNTTLEYEVAVL